MPPLPNLPMPAGLLKAGLFKTSVTSWVLVLVVANLLFYELLFSEVGLIRYWQNESKILQYQERVKVYESEIFALQQKIDQYQNDPESLKTTLKDQFDWVSPNEIVFQFQDQAK